VVKGLSGTGKALYSILSTIEEKEKTKSLIFFQFFFFVVLGFELRA
jgi:hypothetical protein